jgi:hypothetical protein
MGFTADMFCLSLLTKTGEKWLRPHLRAIDLIALAQMATFFGQYIFIDA